MLSECIQQILQSHRLNEDAAGFAARSRAHHSEGLELVHDSSRTVVSYFITSLDGGS